MKDIINSFKAHLYERTSSPLIGAFIFYWIICNYKLIMIIFDGEMKLNEKFDLIKTIYPQERITLWNGFDIYYQILLGNGLLIPLIITLIYILLLPFASNYIYSLWIKHQNKLKKISNEKVLTKKEFGDLQRRFTELELSFDDVFSKKDNEINSLKELLDNKEKINLQIKNNLDSINQKHIEEINSLTIKYKEELLHQNDEIQRLTDKINGRIENKNIHTSLITMEEYHLLEFIGENPENNTSLLINRFKQKRIEIERNCYKLLDIGFIEINENYSDGDKSFRITQKGREYLLTEVPF
ncbi:hypothetical protein [Aliarcobacter butzleri]|uniref:hypothetical protein n=1 Tax=Aliarcobacter butzleri TaxID=28197 RepID=UPI00215A9CF3|nr:hypothetical protein [Aliarcobacter butzleri]MCR8710134.1 hypothetical protein [Aliarcobacter butzleri]